jgi:hypothetical protein
MMKFLRIKFVILFLISALTYFTSGAQSEMIKEVFRLLPADKVYHLTLATRDSILAGKTYYPADNDSTEVVAYNYGLSEYANDYLYVSMSFETGQRATGMIEIRSFKMLNGHNMILVSQAGGVWQVNYSQHQLSTFIYGKDKKLIAFNKKILPATDVSIFMKPGIPASAKNDILKNSNMTFDLSNKKLMLSLGSRYISDNKNLGKWLKGDTVYFDWIKDRFVETKMEFE